MAAGGAEAAPHDPANLQAADRRAPDSGAGRRPRGRFFEVQERPKMGVAPVELHFCRNSVGRSGDYRVCDARFTPGFPPLTRTVRCNFANCASTASSAFGRSPEYVDTDWGRGRP